jgi:hypothetical protein
VDDVLEVEGATFKSLSPWRSTDGKLVGESGRAEEKRMEAGGFDVVGDCSAEIADRREEGEGVDAMTVGVALDVASAEVTETDWTAEA